MQAAYPIGPKVKLKFIDQVAIISAITFYPDYIKYQLWYSEEGKIQEVWYSDFYFTVVGEEKKIGFNV